MNNLQSILSHIHDTLNSLPEWNHLEEFVREFHSMWLKFGNFVQQSLFPAKIEEKEAQYDHPRTKREKRSYTPLGEMVLVRRAKDHQKVGKKRGVIRQREYVATLKSRTEFSQRVSQLYHQVAGKKPTKTVFLGDGAHWIWSMASEQFPGAVEILDFFHLSEYVWAVAKAAYPNKEDTQKDWVKTQQQLLKKSEWTTVIENCHQFPKKKKDLTKAITDLERYLTNNQSRIDYRSYLKAGLMIGSGVVESSNRRVVTQRLKQAGMHWSFFGAEGVMALRAAYLSSSSRWSNFWSSKSDNSP